MKYFAVGCIGTALGLVLGSILTLGTLQAAGVNPAQLTVVPTPSISQPDVTVTVSAAFLNSQLQQAVRQSGLSKQASAVLASPNLIQIAIDTDVTAFGIPFTVNTNVSMRVTVRQGRILLTVDKVDAGGVEIPQSLVASTVENARASAEAQINQSVQSALQGTTLRVVNVRITPIDLSVDLVSQ